MQINAKRQTWSLAEFNCSAAGCVRLQEPCEKKSLAILSVLIRMLPGQ